MNDPKNELRQSILRLLRNQKEEDRFTKSSVIREKLILEGKFQKALTILFYASFNGEVQTFEIMKQAQALGKKLSLPLIHKDTNRIIARGISDLGCDLEPGKYGIPQPKAHTEELPLDDLDLVVVPGVAFDKKNNRLGRGGGYYDRFLAQLPSDTPTIGLAFDFQIVDHIPNLASHDIPVSHVITN